ncbi:hypothetical protein GCM10009863_48670 [Streptomyces axinellae]|uniref:Phytase-like domain-containing protein n=2 Tax=Streptomyces axinellae TaxID=552788 RepID=A0ABP6CX01_9ACTN
MGGAFEVTHFAVDATARLGTPALALVTWRPAHAAPPPPAGPPPDESPAPAPAADAATLLENAEGMAPGDQKLTGPHKGQLPLYLVSDNNESADQRTRVYALGVRLPK